MRERIVFSPDVGGLEELGVTAAEEFFEPQRFATGARAELVARAGSTSEWRVPLPAGTGWLRVRLFAARPTDTLRLALTAPASTSPAAREWNLLCRLAAMGVGVPAVVALLELGERSCLVTRELTGFLPVRSWLAARGAEERELGLTSLRHALAQLERSRVWLPRLTLDDLLLEDRALSAAAEARADDCAAVTLTQLVARGAATGRLAARGLVVEPLPGVAIASVAGGRLAARPVRPAFMGAHRRRALVERLEREARATP